MREAMLMLLLRAMRLCGLRSYRHRTIADRILVLDHAAFERMTIVDCEFVYHGGGFLMRDSDVSGATWVFEGAAANTLTLFRTLYRQDPEFILNTLAADGGEPS